MRLLRFRQEKNADALLHAGLVTWRGSGDRQILQLTWRDRAGNTPSVGRVLSNDERKALRRALKRR